jgi:endonuclease/exonuclease/phosphatase family metal-dependent hydrolase
MKIYSWNMYCYNRKLDRAFSYIQNLDFDVLCLQEVKEEFLERLKTLPYPLVSGVDIIKIPSRRRKQVLYTVIVSKYPILNSQRLSFPESPRPLRMRLFLLAMKPFGWVHAMDRGSIFADIDAGREGRFRIFSLHLNLAGPSYRARELSIVEKYVPEGHSAILAGDFNIVEHWFFKFVSWLLGSPISEAVPSFDERSFVEAFFESLGFQNPLRGTVTHPFSRSQLDHILVPQRCAVTDFGVVKKSYGSDHRPVYIQVKN